MPTRPTLARAPVLLIFVALATATLIPLWREPGWPVNHTGPALALIARIYARHFSWLDLMPLWSSIDVSGFGSPMPVLYHKLFYMMAGALALATGSVKSADVFVVALLLVAGATGLYLTTRALDASRLAATAAGCSLITANYTVTNWLVRGALAEFCGAMLVPWVLLYFVKAIQRGRLPIGLGLALGLLWLSHSVLAFYVGLLLAVTYLLLVVWRLAPLSALRPRTAWPSVMCFAFLVGPYLLPMTMLGRRYDMTRMLTRPYRPVYQFVTPSYYLWDSHWRFGRTATGLTFQLDHAMLLLMATGLCALCLRKPGTADTADTVNWARWRVLRPTLPLLIVAALGLLLQLPVTAPFYERVPGAAFIQFPWRLLALITPALIVPAVYLADKALPLSGRRVALCAATIWMVASCGSFVPLQGGRMEIESLPLDGVTFSGFREYEPRGAAPLAETQTKLSTRWSEAGCSYDNLDANSEVPTVRFRTVCVRAAVLPLPLYASPFHAVTTSTYPHSQPCLALREFPGICGATIPGRAGTVSVKLPSVASLAGWTWARFAFTLRSPARLTR